METKKELSVMIDTSNYETLEQIAKERGVSKDAMINYLIRAVRM